MKKNTWKAEVEVTLKKSVLDPQGETVKHAVHTLGYKNIDSVRMGKYIELSFSAKTRAEAEKLVDHVCKKILVNPVIETAAYRIKGKE